MRNISISDFRGRVPYSSDSLPVPLHANAKESLVDRLELLHSTHSPRRVVNCQQPTDSRAEESASNDFEASAEPHRVYRHVRWVRVTHWINAISFMLLIPSGALIVWAHPEFYWGETGYFGDPTVIKLHIAPNFDIAPVGRNLHFFGAWILVVNGAFYLAAGFVSRHFRDKLLPARGQLTYQHLSAEVYDHLRLKPPVGEDALHYNALQKFAYLVVIFGFIPVMLLSGLTMSPGTTAALPGLFTLFRGRQSARTIHFIVANWLLLFLLVHLFEVAVAGFKNEIRSMITGWFVVPRAK